eukprot:m.108725 g.108725  ORF g.108725 m.108725 type:complete len:69 (-) comp12818_c0_seq3:797-1003(-)
MTRNIENCQQCSSTLTDEVVMQKCATSCKNKLCKMRQSPVTQHAAPANVFSVRGVTRDTSRQKPNGLN